MGRRGLPPGWIWGPDGRPVNRSSTQAQWKVTAPVIQDGKVVFTAPDARSRPLHQPARRLAGVEAAAARRRPVLAGVYNGKVLIVGKKRVPRPEPDQGRNPVEAGDRHALRPGHRQRQHLLPAAARPPHDQRAGNLRHRHGQGHRPRPHARRATKEVPGNLIFYEGDVVSQTVT